MFILLLLLLLLWLLVRTQSTSDYAARNDILSDDDDLPDTSHAELVLSYGNCNKRIRKSIISYTELAQPTPTRILKIYRRRLRARFDQKKIRRYDLILIFSI